MESFEEVIDEHNFYAIDGQYPARRWSEHLRIGRAVDDGDYDQEFNQGKASLAADPTA